MPRRLLTVAAFVVACLLASDHPRAQQVPYTPAASQKSIVWTSASPTTCASAFDSGCIVAYTAQMTSVYIDVAATGSPAFTAGRIVIEGDDDHNVFIRTLGEIPLAHFGDAGAHDAEYHYGPINTNGLTAVRIRLATAITGAGTITAKIRAMGGTDSSKTAPITTTRIMTTTTLGSGASYISPWFDTMLDGAVTIYAHSFATTIGSSASGFILQGTDDTTNANLTVTLGTALTATASVISTYVAPISTRFYRASYVNGAGTQGAFELTMKTGSTPPFATDSVGVTVFDAFQFTSTQYAMGLQPSISSANATSLSFKTALTTAVNVKATAGNLYGFYYSGGATTCFIQFLNASGAGTLGTAIIAEFPIAAITGVVQPPSGLALANFSSGIAVGVSSAVNGATACGTAGQMEVIFQ